MVFSLTIATILRIFLVIISYGCKVPAGIFVPSMAIGASFGRTVGILVQALHESMPQSALFASCEPDVPCITPGTYAFLGAAAALSGIMHITVSVVVIMFELTGALTYILPTMVRCCPVLLSPFPSLPPFTSPPPSLSFYPSGSGLSLVR
jgi:chloride channel 3/4/5